MNAKHCAIHFTHIISYFDNPCEVDVIIHINEDTEKLSNFSKVTKLRNGTLGFDPELASNFMFFSLYQFS